MARPASPSFDEFSLSPTTGLSSEPPRLPLQAVGTIPVDEKKDDNAQNLPLESIFPYGQFDQLLSLLASSFDKDKLPPGLSYWIVTKLIPLILATLGASGYHPTGPALFNYFKEIGLFSEATPSFWGQLWALCITSANFFQILKFAGAELTRLYPKLSQAWNEKLYELYGQQEEGSCKQALKIALQLITALGLQTSIGLMVQAATGSWGDFALVVSGEFILMLSAVLLLLALGKDAWHWIIKSLFSTSDDITTVQVKYRGEMDVSRKFSPKVHSPELSRFSQAIITQTLKNFTDRLQEVMRDAYQAYLTSSDQTGKYGSIQSNGTTFEDILQKVQKNGEPSKTLKPILALLAESTAPTIITSLEKNIEASLRFSPTSEASFRYLSAPRSGFNPVRIFVYLLTTAPMVVVFPLNVLKFLLDPESPELPFAVNATFALSAGAISYLIAHINKGRVGAVFNALETIQKKGISHWYATAVRPAAWPHNTWMQAPYLLSLSVLMVIASQAYSSLLKGMVSSISYLLGIEGESLKILAAIFWPVILISNTTFNLNFMSDALKSVEGFINWLASKWATPRQKDIIAFDAQFTQLLAYLVMPYKHSTTLFPEQPRNLSLLIQTFFFLFQECILNHPENEREAMARKCFSMSLDDLKRVMVTTVQELHLNPELDDLKQSLARTNYLEQITDLLAEFEVTLTSDSSDSDEKSLPKKATLPFELTDDNIVSLKKVPAKKTSSWSWCSLYSRGNSSESKDDSMEPILVRIGAEDEVSEEQARASRSSSSIWNCFRRRSESINGNGWEPILGAPVGQPPESSKCTIM